MNISWYSGQYNEGTIKEDGHKAVFCYFTWDRFFYNYNNRSNNLTKPTFVTRIVTEK
ncbi:hypothetical protein GCM10008013_31640 [Paenibacillus segetis]|uniref:Uncharacterized protein n=1 Tax=Paenibacillus segetis TaxID=1325360 RepID=A0ABQ1YM48_9BACL|nr:hypothetical protein GCM10008013_31640 [Paenibacillus segetis]